jgi:hypothetical protein
MDRVQFSKFDMTAESDQIQVLKSNSGIWINLTENIISLAKGIETCDV